jgi:hypothetical protein
MAEFFPFSRLKLGTRTCNVAPSIEKRGDSRKYPNDTNIRESEKSALTPAFGTTFACLSLHMRDRIRLLRFPAEDVTQLVDIIRRSWPRGIQAKRVYDAANEVKLYGKPWGLSSCGNGVVDARRLICRILSGLLDMGWKLEASFGVCQIGFGNGTLAEVPSPLSLS